MPPQRPTHEQHYSTYDPTGSRMMAAAAKHEGRRGPWSPQEDNLLKELVEKHGAGNWVAIQNGIHSRTAKQCRERWHQNLDPKLNHDPITPDEGMEIDRLVEKLGKRWADIARHLKGRSDNAVKNWWNGGENRRRREQARTETTYYASRSPQYSSPGGYWQSQQPSQPQWPQQRTVYEQPYHGPGPTLAPILTHPHEQPRQQYRSTIPAPIAIPVRGYSRDMPSPAVSLPSMTEDAPSPGSIHDRRNSIVHTPVNVGHNHYSDMIRTASNGSSRSDALNYHPLSHQQNDSPKTVPCVPRGFSDRVLPPIGSLFQVPAPRELGHLINPQQQSPQQNQSPTDREDVRLPSFSNLNRGNWKDESR